LFVIFINDLPLNVESDVYMFADDTKLYRDIANQSDIEIIQNDINNLFKWSEKFLTHTQVWLLIPYERSLLISLMCGTLSKAFIKSV
jgi:hypothetical protein